MPDHVYRIIEVAGSSETSIEDAIQSAVGGADGAISARPFFAGRRSRRLERSADHGASRVNPTFRTTW